RDAPGDKLSPSLVTEGSSGSPSIARFAARSRTVRPATQPLVALPPLPPAGHQPRTPLGLRTQSAALFALLAILVSGLMGLIAVANHASDPTNIEREAPLSGQVHSAKNDPFPQSADGEVFQWNNAMAANDLPGA